MDGQGGVETYFLSVVVMYGSVAIDVYYKVGRGGSVQA